MPRGQTGQLKCRGWRGYGVNVPRGLKIGPSNLHQDRLPGCGPGSSRIVGHFLMGDAAIAQAFTLQLSALKPQGTRGTGGRSAVNTASRDTPETRGRGMVKFQVVRRHVVGADRSGGFSKQTSIRGLRPILAERRSWGAWCVCHRGGGRGGVDSASRAGQAVMLEQL